MKNRKISVSQCVQLILKTVSNLSQNVTEEDLTSARKHLLGSIQLGQHEPRYVAAEYTQDLYHLGKVLSLDEKIKLIKSLTLKDIVSVSQEVFQTKYCSISYSGSKEYLEEYPHIIVLSWAFVIVFLMWAVFSCLGLHTKQPRHIKKRQ